MKKLDLTPKDPTPEQVDACARIMLRAPYNTVLHWNRASHEQKFNYAMRSCQECEEKKIGRANADVVMREMDRLFAQPEYHGFKIGAVFGIAFALHSK